MDNETQTSREKKTLASGGKNSVFLEHVQGLRTPRQASTRLDEAANLPKINKLIGDVWCEGELHILFADTGLGKSIWAIQWADSISKGKSLLSLFDNQSEPLTTIVYDFELSDKQFFTRYSSDDGRKYMFAKNLYVDQINMADLLGDNSTSHFMEILFEKFKYDIKKTGAKVIFIDNITYLSTMSTADTQAALEIMQKLDRLKKEYEIAICVIAHTPKRPLNVTLSLNDLGGSKQLSNFCDSISVLGSSKLGKEFRYFKQIKPSRTGEKIYDTNNVVTLKLEKPDNFLRMKFEGFSSEFDHLGDGQENQTNVTSQMEEVFEFYKQGYSYRDISEKLNIPKSTIYNWIKGKKIQDDENNKDLPF